MCVDSDKIETPRCIFVVLFSSYLTPYTWHIYYIAITNHNPTEGIPTWRQWWGLRGQMILRPMLTVALLLVRPSMPVRSKVMTQTKRGTVVLQFGGWAWGWQPHPVKNIFVEMSLTFLSKSSPDGKKTCPSLKGPRKGASLPCSPKCGSWGNIRNEFLFLGMGKFQVKDLIPNFLWLSQTYNLYCSL